MAGREVFLRLSEAYGSEWRTLPPPVTAVLARPGVAVEAPNFLTAGQRFTLLTEFGRGLLEQYRAVPDYSRV